MTAVFAPALIGIACVVSVSACASPSAEALRASYFAGDYEEAKIEVIECAESDEASAHLWALQQSMVEFARVDPQSAVRMLGIAKEGVLERSSYASRSWLDQALENTSAMLSDDNALEYGGRDYEHLMMYSLLTLGELLKGGRGDEMAYGFQGLDRLLEAIDAFEDPDGNNPKEDYKLIPLGEYLRAAFYEETPSRINDTRRAYGRFHELVGEYEYAEQDLARLSGEVRKGNDMGVVHLFTFVGEGPSYIESRDYASAHVLQWAQVFVGLWRGEGFTLPNLGAIKTQTLDANHHDGYSSRIRIDGKPAGQTAVVADVWASAHAEFLAMRDTLLLRAVLRRVFKSVMTEVVDNQIEDEVLSLVSRIFASIWTLTERADLRAWSLLPATVQALRLELPPGPHTIEVQAIDARGNPVGLPQVSKINVNRIHQSYVLGILPCSTSGGSIVSSNPVIPSSVPSAVPSISP